MVPDRGVFIVADGMGGHAAGEVASEMAVRIIARELGDLSRVTNTEASDLIRRSIIEANSTIFQRTLSEQDKRGMGTTATAMVIIGDKYLIGQVGDSRPRSARASALRSSRSRPGYTPRCWASGWRNTMPNVGSSTRAGPAGHSAKVSGCPSATLALCCRQH